MDLTSILIFLAIGAVAGWLAGVIMKGGGFGLVGDIIVGIIGAVLGGWLFGVLGITAGGLIGAIITATVGACVLLLIVRMIKKA
ncbi:MAG: GlsB/YeaQ/YmgE family stress response membrane protein [Acidobacteria bacterium]|nr:GlsB/YeaQ/YmgE family stress response membrane protein [Candidatus Sulfomarinibacter sp. MAG AM1]